MSTQGQWQGQWSGAWLGASGGLPPEPPVPHQVAAALRAGGSASAWISPSASQPPQQPPATTSGGGQTVGAPWRWVPFHPTHRPRSRKRRQADLLFLGDL